MKVLGTSSYTRIVVIYSPIVWSNKTLFLQFRRFGRISKNSTTFFMCLSVRPSVRPSACTGYGRRYSDYPDAYTTWNIISSIGSTISFVSATIFLFITRERITSNGLILFPIHTKNWVEWLQNFPPAEHRYSELPTISLTN